MAPPNLARTLPAALSAALVGDAARPFVTWVGPEGVRTELSVRTYENNVAKAANLLQDDAGVAEGSRVVVQLPPHWQTAVWLGACAVTGACAWLGGDEGDASVDAAVVGPGYAGPPRAPLTLATSLHPLGMPSAEPLAPGVLDAAIEVRGHGDRFAAYAPPAAGTPWLLDGDWAWTHAEALDAMHDLASGLGLSEGGRILVRATSTRTDYRTAGALVALPLAIGGSVVLLTDPDADVDAVAVAEHCDAAIEV